MILPSDSALRQIPEFLLREKEDADNLKELLEQLNPNAVNTTAALVDKIMSELPDMNTWTDLETYITEFKLDEVFEGLDDDFYSVKQSELLKGFFTFKGTELDLAYIMRVAGYTLRIFDADYYRRGTSLFNILMDSFPGEFDDLLNKMDPATLDKFFETFLRFFDNVIVVDNVSPTVLDNLAELKVVNESEELQENILTGLRGEVHLVDNVNPMVLDNQADLKVINVGSDFVNNVIHIVNNLTPLVLDNLAGLKVVNENSDNQSLLSYGIQLTPHQIERLLQAIQLWRQNLDAFDDEFDENLDCTLTSELFIDMDSEKFMSRGFKASEVLQDIRQLLEFRLLVCIYVRAIKATLETKDFLERTRRDEDTESTLLIEVPEVAPQSSEAALDTEVGVGFAEEIEFNLFAPEVYDTLSIGAHITRKIDNVNIYRIPGRKRNYETYSKVYEKIGAHVTMKVNNGDPYRVPGRVEQFNDNYNPEYPPGIDNDVGIVIDNLKGRRILGDKPQFNHVILDTFAMEQEFQFQEDYKPWMVEVFDKSTDNRQEYVEKQDKPFDYHDSVMDVEFAPEDVRLDKPLVVDNETPYVVDNVTPIIITAPNSDFLSTVVDIHLAPENLWTQTISESDIDIVPDDTPIEDVTAPEDSEIDTVTEKTYADELNTGDAVHNHFAGSVEVIQPTKVTGKLKVGGGGVIYNDMPLVLGTVVVPNSTITTHTLTGFM